MKKEAVMGPVNWLAVALAAVIALAIGTIRYGAIFRNGRQLLPGKLQRFGSYIAIGIVFLISAIMLGHAYARIGSDTLTAKPWLYFMQSGGIALAFVMPSVWLTHFQNKTEPVRRLADCLFWLISYLAMGFVFWALS